MIDPYVPKNGVCMQHGCASLVLDRQCQISFDDGWVDVMTDDQHRDARDRGIAGAIRDLKIVHGMQCKAIRKPDGFDRVARETIEMAISLLSGVPLKERVKPAKRRRAKR